jgi:Predicted exonuclease of the beta-lactamase fold involved in RNA processing
MMDIQFLGGAGEVGRSAIYINDSLLLDYGLKTATPPQFPVGSVEPEAVVVSHGHLDHVGSIPSLLSGARRPPIHMTGPTLELTRTLAQDTLKLHGGSYNCPFTAEEIRRLPEVAETHQYTQTFSAAGHQITFYNAGHIPGSAHILIDDGETRLLYTADFNTIDQRLVSQTTARPDADVVICETTYSDIEHRARETIETEFVKSVKSTLWEGGTVVIPAFAIGRTQEMLLICEAHGIPCYVDGMGTQITNMLQQYPGFVRNAVALREAKSHARFVTGRDGQRRRIAEKNVAIVTTSGMLSGGPAMTYIPAIGANPVNKITMTGYQVEGTPGRSLLETGGAEIDGQHMTVSAQVEAYDFSAHADSDGIRELLDAYGDATVLLNHGDRCARFAEELRSQDIEASAPEIGQTLTV